MKARRGFVSNSSSSSFVLVVEKEAHDKAMPGLHPFVRAAIKQYAKAKACLGRPCMVISSCHPSGAGHFEYEEGCMRFDGERPKDKYGELMSIFDAVMAYKEAAEKQGADKVFYDTASDS